MAFSKRVIVSMKTVLDYFWFKDVLKHIVINCVLWQEVLLTMIVQVLDITFREFQDLKSIKVMNHES